MIGKVNDLGIFGRNNRLFIEAILWMASNKGLWHLIPPQFGKWNAIYMRFRRWTEANFWRFLLAQREIKDPDLLLLLAEIADYADLYTRRKEQRLIRRNYKKLYMSEVSESKGLDQDISISHPQSLS